jgi:hypothetical protein
VFVRANPGDVVSARGRESARRPSAGAASADARLPHQEAHLLHLQRTAGNRAVTMAIQRSAAGDLNVQTELMGLGGLGGWELAEQAVRASASKHELSALYPPELEKYAEANSDDGKMLLNAKAKAPSHYKGGVLLAAQKDAAAITFGNSIFYRDDPTLSTYIHEMVHINQYDVLGREAFLLSYFGMSLATIIKRALKGEPINVMKSSPHENQAYEVEQRFKKWRFKT